LKGITYTEWGLKKKTFALVWEKGEIKNWRGGVVGCEKGRRVMLPLRGGLEKNQKQADEHIHLVGGYVSNQDVPEKIKGKEGVIG